MDHCGGGVGPNAVGGVFGLPAPSYDPAHDVVAALAHSAEDGVAPGQIIATRYRDNDPTKGIEAQRPWCAYPAQDRATVAQPPALFVRSRPSEAADLNVHAPR